MRRWSSEPPHPLPGKLCVSEVARGAIQHPLGASWRRLFARGRAAPLSASKCVADRLRAECLCSDSTAAAVCSASLLPGWAGCVGSSTSLNLLRAADRDANFGLAGLRLTNRARHCVPPRRRDSPVPGSANGFRIGRLPLCKPNRGADAGWERTCQSPILTRANAPGGSTSFRRRCCSWERARWCLTHCQLASSGVRACVRASDAGVAARCSSTAIVGTAALLARFPFAVAALPRPGLSPTGGRWPWPAFLGPACRPAQPRRPRNGESSRRRGPWPAPP